MWARKFTTVKCVHYLLYCPTVVSKRSLSQLFPFGATRVSKYYHCNIYIYILMVVVESDWNRVLEYARSLRPSILMTRNALRILPFSLPEVCTVGKQSLPVGWMPSLRVRVSPMFWLRMVKEIYTLSLLKHRRWALSPRVSWGRLMRIKPIVSHFPHILGGRR